MFLDQKFEVKQMNSEGSAYYLLYLEKDHSTAGQHGSKSVITLLAVLFSKYYASLMSCGSSQHVTMDNLGFSESLNI